MALLDGPFRTLAKTLIATLGATATLKRTAPEEYDPVEGVSGVDRETSVSVKISPPDRYSREEVERSGGAIQHDDFRVLLAASGLLLIPSPQTDVLIVAGTTFQIVLVGLVYSGDQVAAYELQVRS